MKNFILILMLIAVSLSAQSWNSIITTNINVTNVQYMENYADKSGIHIVTLDSYNDIKYYLISSSGSTIRSSTISTSGEYPNIVGDKNAVYIVYREGSNIRVKKSTDAGATWSERTNQPIGSNPCSGIDATINADGIHVVWSIGDSDGYSMETNYKRFDDGYNNWYDFKTVTDYSNGYGTSPTVAVSPSRVHVGYNSFSTMPDDYYAFDEEEMSRTKYNDVWQTQQQISSDACRGKIFAASSKLYDFYYDAVNDMGLYYFLYYKYRDIGASSWSTATLLEPGTDVSRLLAICETANGNIHTYTAYGVVSENIIINGSVNSTNYVSNSGSIYALDASAVYNDIYLTWSISESDYLKLRQYDSAPQMPQSFSASFPLNASPTLTWEANNEPDIAGYRVYKKLTTSSGTITSYDFTTNTSYTDDDFTTQIKFGSDTAEYWVVAVDNSNNLSDETVHESTNGTSLIQWKIGTEQEDNNTITDYQLFNNYPNPFNPTTQISYQIPKDGFVSLTVYNSLGQKVAILVNKNQSSGKYSVQFDASNLPSGIFIYKLQANGFSSVKKMMLTK